jgi:DnaJ-class molecular chaperone
MATDDPYATLGVARDADQAAIRSAYRKLAKQLHPDLHPGDKQAEEKFKAVTAAYDLLSDAEKRARFDRGEIDASGQERPERHFYRQHAEGRSGAKYGGPGAGGEAEDDLGDIFSDFFFRSGGGEQRGFRLRGRDRSYTLTATFLEAVNGTTKRLTLPDGKTLDVRIPPGVEDGQVLRLKGQGGPGLNGGPPGDALIEIGVAPHSFFRREGNDIHVDVPVTLAEAVLGARITVPTIRGNVTMTVPQHSDTGTRLRLRRRGVPAHGGRAAGDQYVTLKVVIGEQDQALEEFLRDWGARHATDPRRTMTETMAGAA